MNYTFSAPVAAMQPSAIREIFKYMSDPEVISFAAGNPAPAAFPVETVREITADILETDPIGALQYGLTEGVISLRDHLKTRMTAQGCFKEQDELIITSGAQQVMELAAKTLCNPGDTIICEAPSFIGSLNSFRSMGLKLRGVELEEDGISLSGLEQALKEEKRCRLIYLIPNFQNPTGITMSAEKRTGVMNLAKQYGVMIIEDNPYGELRFAGDDIPSVKSLDRDGQVIYAGSFSKVLSPGLRVGYAIAPKEVIQKMVVCKQGSDVHTPCLSQMIADRFMFTRDFDSHIAHIRQLYKEKADQMISLAKREFGAKVSFTKPQGGLFIWCTLPDGADMPGFVRDAVLQKVAVVPGNAFAVDQNAPNFSFRLNFSMPSAAQIDQGMGILGKLIRGRF